MRSFVATWLCVVSSFLSAAEILLPQGRTAFQTNEWIDVSVVRSGDSLAAGELNLLLTDEQGSRLEFTFPAAAGGKQRTEHLHLNGRLLRPGVYQVQATVDGQTAKSMIEVYSHVRQSSFRLINWGGAKTREQQLVQGENGLGFNLFYGHYGTDVNGDFIRGGVDFMANCVMSGGHQMDLRMECDWSDPYVTKGGTRRVVRRAFIDRTRPNVPGVHFYDEPGLTWHKHPDTGEMTPHGLPSQIRSYKAAFGKDPIQYHKVDPNNAEQVAAWKHFNTWKLGFMDAAWKESQFGVSRVRPDYLSVTQSQYGWTAFGDGYYFNVVRSLPVTSGHGGYHDYGLGTFNPSMFLEMSRARDRWKPCWYLPTWYGNTTADQYRCEQYLSFQTHLQGMISPPDCEPATNPVPRQGIVESNQLMKRLGPVFTTMPPTKPPVAILYSLSQLLDSQAKDRGANYAHASLHGEKLSPLYLAGKMLQHQFDTIVDEDVLDGTLATDYRAIVLTGLTYLDPQVIAGLEAFAKQGGLVVLTGECTVNVAGAKKLNVTAKMPDEDKIKELTKAAKYDQLAPYTTVAKQVEGSKELAAALAKEFSAAGIKPVFGCDKQTIAATRQAAGDVEYLFAVNWTPDADARNEKDQVVNNMLLPTSATISIPNDGRPVYDVLQQQTINLAVAGQPEIAITGRFGAGQMRVLARTTKPIGGVKVALPQVKRDLVVETNPLSVDLAAIVVDNAGGLLTGSIPLEVRVLDPLGGLRHELFHATKQGHFAVSLPLAANDPAGEWKVSIRELISGQEGVSTFKYSPPPSANGLAGAERRAVRLNEDNDNVFRFARTFDQVTVVAGSSDYSAAAVERVTKALEPWGVKCVTMPVAEAAKSRSLTEDEAKTWVGLQYTGTGAIKAGAGNAPALSGFAVRGPVILIGNPEDNALIAFLQKEQFLPYSAAAGKFPGTGRGYFAWQRDGVGAGQESITLVAHDAEGMAEAVGSFYEAAAGIDPLTRYAFPTKGAIKPASTGAATPQLPLAAAGALPDRIVGLKIEGGQLTALSYDGTQATGPLGSPVDARQGKLLDKAAAIAAAKALATPVDPAKNAEAQKQQPRFLTRFVVTHGANSAIASWGGRLEVRDKEGKLLAASQLPQDITSLAAADGTLVIGLADGRIFASK